MCRDGLLIGAAIDVGLGTSDIDRDGNIVVLGYCWRGFDAMWFDNENHLPSVQSHERMLITGRYRCSMAHQEGV